MKALIYSRNAYVSLQWR